MYLSIFICMHIHVCVCVCVFAHLCMRACEHECIRARMFVRERVRVRVIWMSAHVCCVWVCEREIERERRIWGCLLCVGLCWLIAFGPYPACCGGSCLETRASASSQTWSPPESSHGDLEGAPPGASAFEPQPTGKQGGTRREGNIQRDLRLTALGMSFDKQISYFRCGFAFTFTLIVHWTALWI